MTSQTAATGTRDPSTALLDQVIPALSPWSNTVRRGQVLRIADACGQQSADTLFYNATDHGERYSVHDTLREQGSPYIDAGSRLISSEGRVMLTVLANTGGPHDTSAGACSCESNTVRFGHHTRYMHACRDNFLSEALRHGMDKRDIVPNINFFMNVPIEPDGKLAIVDGVSMAGSYVELRAEMDVLCLISNCPQINNPCNGFDPTPLRVLIFAD